VKLRLQGRAPRLPRAPFLLLDRPIAPIGGGKLKFGGYLGFGGFLTCCQKFTLYAALYIGFLDSIIVGKDSNTFLVCIELYLTKIQKNSGRG
jgi:hypothetical protein